MAQSSKMRFVSVPHYLSTHDPLEQQYGRRVSVFAQRAINLQEMPPTLSHNFDKVEDKQAEDEENKIIRQLPGYESIIRTPSPFEISPGSIESWIQEFEKSNLIVDIHRLARWAVLCSKLDVVKHLVEKRQADLSKTDKIGRSAIFYCSDRDVFDYVVSKTREHSGIKHLNLKDNLGRTPLHYAVILDDEDAVEYLIASNANINIKDKRQRVAIDYLTESISIHSIRLLFAFQKIVDENPRGIYAECKAFFIPRLQLTQLQSDLITDRDQSKDMGPPFWTHFYWTNGILVHAALRKLKRYLRNGVKLGSVLRKDFSWGDISENLPVLGYRECSYYSNFDKNKAGTLQVTIVFPCLHLRGKEWQQEMHKKTWELKKRVADGTSEHHIHYERTLDETYYPGLSSTVHDKRNNEQVVFKEYDPTGKSKENKESLILTIPQLWIWRIGDHIVSAYPTEIRTTDRDRREYLYSDTAAPLSNKGSATGLIMAKHVSRFGLKHTETGFPSTLDIFEASVVKILGDVQNYTEGTKSSRPSMEKDHEYMTRIANVREQLNMIRAILGQQLDILTRFIDDFEQRNPECLPFLARKEKTKVDDQNSATRDQEWMEWDWKMVKDSVLEIHRYLSRVSKIDGDAERVEKRIQDQLNLTRTYASIRDARAGLVLSAAVIGFTVTTIIFAPLAFTTASFALPLDTLLSNQVEFNGRVGDADAGQQTTTPAYTSRYVGTWFAVAEITTLVVTLSFILLCLWFIDETVVRRILPMEKAKEFWHKIQEYWDSIKRAPSTGAIEYFWNLMWNAIVGNCVNIIRAGAGPGVPSSAGRGQEIELQSIAVTPNGESHGREFRE